MKTKSYHLNRRTFLRGAGGVGLGLPMLEAMSWEAGASPAAAAPKRLCGVYFPFSIAVLDEDHPESKWNWFPKHLGSDNYEFTSVLESFEPHRKEITILEGLSHPRVRSMGGHDSADPFLTSAHMAGTKPKNTVSLDQVAARVLGKETRSSSLVLSVNGGTGDTGRIHTLSHNLQGYPIPALASPKQIYERLFVGTETGRKAERKRLTNSLSVVDMVLDDMKSLKGRLGKYDQDKVEEFVSSVREVEQGVEKSQKWLDISKPKVDPGKLTLEVGSDEPIQFMKTLYDLIYLAFQTDSTRVATYMLGAMGGANNLGNAFPAAIGLAGDHHGLAHNARNNPALIGKWNQLQAQQFADFITRLKSTPEGEGSMLDNTVVLYGATNSTSHTNSNYPLALAGGRGLGFGHGRHLRFDKKDGPPLSNLFVTMLNQVGVPTERFGDSTGAMKEVLG